MWFLIPVIAIGVVIPFRKANGEETSILNEVIKGVDKGYQFGPFGYENKFASQDRFDDLFQKYGEMYGIDPKILKSMAIQESSLNPNARNSTTSAFGLMQITKAAAADVGESWENQRDPETAIRSGAKYLRLQMDTWGFSVADALKAYFAGAGTVLDGKAGRPFKQSWQENAWRFAQNTYAPKILNRAQNLSIA